MFSPSAGVGSSLIRRGLRQAAATRPSLFGQAIRSLFIQTENTPNPESIKFIPGRPVLDVDEGGEVGAGFFVNKSDREEVGRSPLAKYLFEVDGVKSLYLGSDFLTVTKTAESHWVSSLSTS